MKTKFPKLNGFMIKSKTPAKAGDEKNAKLDFSSAFVYKRHLIATNGQIFIVYNLKEYMKYHIKNSDGEEMANAFEMVDRVCEYLEGKSLSSEFFATFSKEQEFNNVDEFKMSITQNGLHSEVSVDTTYNVEKLESFLEKRKNVWQKVRTEQNGYYGFSLDGKVYSTVKDVLGPELGNDQIVFERTSDDQARFCLANKDWVFGITVYSIEGESNLTKFQEANDFFDEL